MKPFIEIPTYLGQTDTWSTTTFDTRLEFKDFCDSLFKEPGLYDFDEVSFKFNEEARKYQEFGIYCTAPFKSKDFINYWDDQKNKCRTGVIYKGLRGQTWYIPRDYYMWLNFLPIYDKEQKKFDFASVRDAQYHMALYEKRAELHFLHVAIFKKRQIASSYYHMGKMINYYYFEEGFIGKIGASLKDYINEKGSWMMLNEYRDFLNQHTAWYRPNEPDKVLAWQQRIKVRKDGRDTYKGLKSMLKGTSFEKNATSGVGGPCDLFFHEEAGIAPLMDQTYEYMRPAMQSGMITTGLFIAAGSVGDLDQCNPLKRMIYDPKANGILPVESTLFDANGTIAITGLFIPEQWSMPPFIDKYGNSQVAEALAAIHEERLVWKKELTPAQYQLRISQKPTTIEEGFATRKTSVFPSHLVSQQARRIEEGAYPVKYVDLAWLESGKVIAKPSRKLPISEFPISRKTEDKTSVICVYEDPMENAPWGMYYASVDPVGEGKSTTSESLCSIIVYKNPVEVSKQEEDGSTTRYVERDKIVATWCGRYDDLNKTHELLEMLIEYYNAWTVVEANVGLFTQHMIQRRKQKYLVPKDQLLFIKDLTNSNTYQAYGWKNTGSFFKTTLLSYGIEFCTEELDIETTVDGEITNTILGIERIPDPMIIEEMKQYQHGLNVDRLVAFCSLVSFAKIQQSNRGMQKRVTVTNDKLDKSNILGNLSIRNPFKHLGFNSATNKRSAFKNMR